MTNNEKIIEYYKRLGEKYRDCLSLMVVYGSAINGTANELSDVDCYFMPNGKDNRVYELCKTYIIGGIGYDLFPLHWDRLEGLSEIGEEMLPFLGNGEVIFAATEEDKARYFELREKMKKSLSDKKLMQERAVGQYYKAMSVAAAAKKLGEIGQCRAAAGRTLMWLADTIAFKNGLYFTRGVKKQLEDLENMNTPSGFTELYADIIKSSGLVEINELLEKACRAVAEFIGVAYEETEPYEDEGCDPVSAAELKGGYCEIRSTFNKVYRCCKSGDYVLAFLSAVCLQETLNMDMDFECDILSAFDYEKLSLLSEKTKKVENAVIKRIEDGGEKITDYNSVEDFIKNEGIGK